MKYLTFFFGQKGNAQEKQNYKVTYNIFQLRHVSSGYVIINEILELLKRRFKILTSYEL